MLIINILFYLFALIAALNLISNISGATGIKADVRDPSVTLMTCANSYGFSEKIGIYAFWIVGLVLGAIFSIFFSNSLGGLVAVVAGVANIFAIRSIIGATGNWMDRHSDEGMHHPKDSQSPPSTASTNLPPQPKISATTAIARSNIPAPPELSQEMVSAHVQLADAQGSHLTPVRHRTSYAGQADSPILLIHGEQVFELVDEFDHVTGKACLAAARDATYFRFVPKTGASDDDADFLTWRFENGRWLLAAMEQYLA